MELKLSPEFERHMEEVIDAQAELVANQILMLIKSNGQVPGLQIAVSN